MIRIINLGSLLESLAPELSRRLRESHLADWTGRVVVSNGEEGATLAIDRSEVAVQAGGDSEHTIRGSREIARLIVGSENPSELELDGLVLTGDASRLVRVLFPAQSPQMENQAL